MSDERDEINPTSASMSASRPASTSASVFNVTMFEDESAAGAAAAAPDTQLLRFLPDDSRPSYFPRTYTGGGKVSQMCAFFKRADTIRYAISALAALTIFAIGWALGRASQTTSVSVVEHDERSLPGNGGVGNARYTERGKPRFAVGTRFAVAADNAQCSAMALRTLQQGGNAVDAAVTATLCQGVRSPFASGVGGGCFAVIRLANGSHYALDAREAAPAAAKETMFVEHKKRKKGSLPPSEVGGLSSGVPGELKGLEIMHRRFGKLPWRDLVSPVAQLARAGFPTSRLLHEALGDAFHDLDESAKRAFGVDDGSGGLRAPKINETCCMRPKFAETLDRVAELGTDALYKGEAGQAWARDIQSNGGIISADDLSTTEPHWRDPVVAPLPGGGRYIGMPPPSSGGVAVAAILGQLLMSQAESNRTDGGATDFAIVEAMMHAYSARMQLGDPGPDPPLYAWQSEPVFQGIRAAVSSMSSPSTWAAWRKATRDGGGYALRREAYGVLTNASLPEDHGTTHVSVADADGNAVALTSTINTEFGAKFVCASNGILMNDEMDDFSTPGVSNHFGFAPSATNYIRPFKRPLSSMSPSIVDDARGRLRVVAGASGGSRIISTTAQVLFWIVGRSATASSAVLAPRWHNQFVPNVTEREYFTPGYLVEDGAKPPSVLLAVDDARAALLEARGHATKRTHHHAVCQAVEVTSHGKLVSVSDLRKDGAPSAE